MEPSAYQRQLGEAAIDAGADLVVGHSPRVVQGMQLYRGRPIFYSVGDLLCDCARPGGCGDGLLVRLLLLGERIAGISVVPVVGDAACWPTLVPPVIGDGARIAADFAACSEQLATSCMINDQEIAVALSAHEATWPR